MGIHRSGLMNQTFIICVRPWVQGDFKAAVGDRFELVLAMATMFVIKTPQGAEILVPKDSFGPA
jgi:hypothetical protein